MPTPVSSPSVELSDLPEDDVLSYILDFVGDYQHIFIARVNRQFRRVYQAKFDKTRTSLEVKPLTLMS